jgi:hypothetical protein
MEHQRSFQFTGMAHAPNGGGAVFLQRSGTQRAGGVEKSRGTKDTPMSLASEFHDIHEKRNISDVPAHQIESIEAATHQEVDH